MIADFYYYEGILWIYELVYKERPKLLPENATKILSYSSNKRVANCCAFKNQEDLQYTR